MDESELKEAFEKLDIFITPTQMEQLNEYYKILIEWNEFMNLTGITAIDQVYLKHFYDSATLCKSIKLNENLSLCDIGTGAGFPGIVLKILFPNLKITLVDSLEKRIKFLNHVIEQLGLKDIATYHARAEEFAISHREKYDIVTARAVASLPILLEYCVPLVKIGRYFIPMKAMIQEELEQSKKAMDQLSVQIEEIIDFELPKEKSKRTIIRFKKMAKTNPIYPRKYSEIKKRPL